jgi:hypothetical protein
MFPRTDTFEDFPGIQVRTFLGEHSTDLLEQALFAVYPDTRKDTGRTE